MPASFDEISGYHSLMAARFAALAQAARERGDIATADYNAEQAVRYVEAAQQQRLAMSHAPGRPIEEPRPRPRPPEPQRVSPAPGRLLAALRGAGHLASAIRQSISPRSAGFHGLSPH